MNWGLLNNLTKQKFKQTKSNVMFFGWNFEDEFEDYTVEEKVVSESRMNLMDLCITILMNYAGLCNETNIIK